MGIWWAVAVAGQKPGVVAASPVGALAVSRKFTTRFGTAGRGLTASRASAYCSTGKGDCHALLSSLYCHSCLSTNSLGLIANLCGIIKYVAFFCRLVNVLPVDPTST